MLKVGLVQRRVLILFRLVSLCFPVLVLLLLGSLAQDQGAVSPSGILESDMSIHWKNGRSGLVGLFGGRSSLLSILFSFALLLLSLSPPWLAPRNRRVHLAVLVSSLSGRLDDATLLPPPPSPNDLFVGKH